MKMTAQSASGDPQKTAPCGPSGAFTPNGEVLTVAPGSMVTISINETVTHAGHYRIALAQNIAGLPADRMATDETRPAENGDQAPGLATRCHVVSPLQRAGRTFRTPPVISPGAIAVKAAN